MQFFEKLAPESSKLNEWYRNIVELGLAKDFTDSTNAIWFDETRPLLEAFWHTRFFVMQMKSSAAHLQTAANAERRGQITIVAAVVNADAV